MQHSKIIIVVAIDSGKAAIADAARLLIIVTARRYSLRGEVGASLYITEALSSHKARTILPSYRCGSYYLLMKKDILIGVSHSAII